ncbi:MAG TPA: hypothetical protein VL991_12150 [Terracidiphilus sp.]|jgi:hypothetical protein|nr:hypothetical protein [Terracidiphilus sp.]
MREEPQMEAGSGREALAGSGKSGLRSGSDLERRFWLALAMYAVLAALVWFTMDAGKVDVLGKPVELRLVPLIIIGGLALRTVLARQAEKFRRDGEKSSS